jgi:hypothetical protein
MKSGTCILILSIIGIFLFSCKQQPRQETALPSTEVNKSVFDSIRNQMHICPGKWRPLFKSEQIFWVSPPWASSEYIYVDFPEAIFVDETPAYLSHVSPVLPTLFNYKLPEVEWKVRNGVYYYIRILKNYMDFGGEVSRSAPNITSMTLWINNTSAQELKNITLQTCAYLYPIKEFSEVTNANKFIHTKDSGWVSLDRLWPPKPHGFPENGTYRIGWRSGLALSDLPFIIAASREPNHLVAMTWFDHTLSFIANTSHPCFHADPFFPDLQPGESVRIQGAFIFFEGSLEDFEQYLQQLYPKYF